MPITKKCQICHKEYCSWNGKFCSWKCYLVWHKGEKETSICPICGKSFTDYKVKKRKVCSKECNFKLRSKQLKSKYLKKEIKGKFGFKKGDVPWNKSMQGYINKGSFQEGNAHMFWRNGSSFEPYGLAFTKKLREKIRKRDNYTCQECGHSQEKLGYKLHIHHIDYDKINNQESNLISLCKSCHGQTCFGRADWTKYFQEKIVGYQSGGNA